MERAFENQKCIEVSLARVYNGSLVLKTEEKSLSKTVTFKKILQHRSATLLKRDSNTGVFM